MTKPGHPTVSRPGVGVGWGGENKLVGGLKVGTCRRSGKRRFYAPSFDGRSDVGSLWGTRSSSRLASLDLDSALAGSLISSNRSSILADPNNFEAAFRPPP